MAKISDEVKSYFLGDTSGLERATATATRVLDTYGKKEQQVALAAKRAFDSRAGNIKNALVNPTGAAVDGLNKLVSSMKMSAVTTGVLGAGITLAADKFSELRSEALQARKETEAFNESFRKSFQGNIHMSGAQDSGSLMGKLADLREQQATLKQKNFDLNPQHGSVAEMMVHGRYLAEDPLHANDNLRRDRDQVKMQLHGNDSQQTAIQKDITASLTRQNKLVAERLQGSAAQAQIMDLQAAKERELAELMDSTANNPANKKLIESRYDQQINAVKEMVKLEGDRFALAGRLRGIEISGRTDAQKRVESAQAILREKQTELLTTENNNTEARNALQSEIAQQNIILTQAKAELAVEQSRTTLARQVITIQSTNLSQAAKQYSTTLATNSALRDQLGVMEKINGTAAEGLREQIAGNNDAIRQMRQGTMFGKSGSAIQKDMQRNRNVQAQRDAFDIHMGKTSGGLLRADRDMNGNITGGTDPITGRYRQALPGEGRAESGLRTGSLSDKPMGTRGEASRIFDRDPNGGLSGGSTPRMFDRTSAAIALDKPTGAESALAKLRGDSAHDPAARLANATTFPDLTAGMRQEFAGGFRIHPDSQAKLDRQGLALSDSQGLFADKEHARYSTELVRQMKGNATKGLKPGMLDGLTTGTLTTGNLNGGATPVGPQLVRPTGHDNDVGHSSSLIGAVNKQIDSSDIGNQFLKQMSMDLSTIAANWGFA